MIFAIMILFGSSALFLLYIQATCQTVLRREFNLQRLTSIVNASSLEFQFVSKALEIYDAQADHRWARTALGCDYQALKSLLKTTALSYAERLPMLYSKALFLALSGMHLLKLNERPAILNLTTILHHFVGVRGEKVTPVDFGRATA
jgi:hypothetical protein